MIRGGQKSQLGVLTGGGGVRGPQTKEGQGSLPDGHRGPD